MRRIRNREHDIYDFQDAVWTAVLGVDRTYEREEYVGHQIVWQCCESLLAHPRSLSEDHREWLQYRTSLSKVYCGLKRILRVSSAFSQKSEYQHAKKLFLQAQQSCESFVRKRAPDHNHREGCEVLSLILWAQVNLSFIDYHLESDKRKAIRALDCKLEEFRPLLSQHPELESPFYFGLFNKATLEFVCDRPHLAALREILYASPGDPALHNLVERTKELLKEANA